MQIQKITVNFKLNKAIDIYIEIKTRVHLLNERETKVKAKDVKVNENEKKNKETIKKHI